MKAALALVESERPFASDENIERGRALVASFYIALASPLERALAAGTFFNSIRDQYPKGTWRPYLKAIECQFRVAEQWMDMASRRGNIPLSVKTVTDARVALKKYGDILVDTLSDEADSEPCERCHDSYAAYRDGLCNDCHDADEKAAAAADAEKAAADAEKASARATKVAERIKKGETRICKSCGTEQPLAAFVRCSSITRTCQTCFEKPAPEAEAEPEPNAVDHELEMRFSLGTVTLHPDATSEDMDAAYMPALVAALRTHEIVDGMTVEQIAEKLFGRIDAHEGRPYVKK